jgi:caffeoyl-CoA O-methyltransferase
MDRLGAVNLLDPRIEAYLRANAPAADPVRARMEAYGAQRRFPLIGPLVGALCYQYAVAARARAVFEMGSGFGYSAWWFARAVGPGGRVVCTDGDPANRDLAEKFLREAGLWDRIDYRVGDACAALAGESGPFDVIFIDVDKEGYPEALDAAVPRLRDGGLILTDNTLWNGRVLEAAGAAADTQGVLEYTRRALAHPALATTIVPVRDGLAVSVKLPPAVLQESPWRSTQSN